MSEKPILFSGPMVRAILEGRKTQTRRIIKPQSLIPDTWSQWGDEARQAVIRHHCPYGKVGDVLRVKETHAFRADGQRTQIAYAADGRWGATSQDWMFFPHGWVVGTSQDLEQKGKWVGRSYFGKWRPSIFMPLWACRIKREIVNVRAERLQDISEEDARAEGVEEITFDGMHGWKDYYGGLPLLHTAKESFATLWDSLNAKPKPLYCNVNGKKQIYYYVSYPWEDIQEMREYRGKPWRVTGNPRVWPIEFRRMEQINAKEIQ